ncbi:hypothetical protein CAOG_001718 [Capsaspora owczarzaki ATCC 30864]|uniref:Uncharacterized protein n=2 Tax=Capsaspora owczarzaki (strain ATCC 30864) TaxID=595528 RepID=A0A0D2VK59_CAPO3|nr:hypothetical protein CAOG_001718 [Capsaspora owczarzaki ATCC 30864]
MSPKSGCDWALELPELEPLHPLTRQSLLVLDPTTNNFNTTSITSSKNPSSLPSAPLPTTTTTTAVSSSTDVNHSGVESSRVSTHSFNLAPPLPPAASSSRTATTAPASSSTSTSASTSASTSSSSGRQPQLSNPPNSSKSANHSLPNSTFPAVSSRHHSSQQHHTQTSSAPADEPPSSSKSSNLRKFTAEQSQSGSSHRQLQRVGSARGPLQRNSANLSLEFAPQHRQSQPLELITEQSSSPAVEASGSSVPLLPSSASSTAVLVPTPNGQRRYSLLVGKQARQFEQQQAFAQLRGTPPNRLVHPTAFSPVVSASTQQSSPSKSAASNQPQQQPKRQSSSSSSVSNLAASPLFRPVHAHVSEQPPVSSQQQPQHSHQSQPSQQRQFPPPKSSTSVDSTLQQTASPLKTSSAPLFSTMNRHSASAYAPPSHIRRPRSMVVTVDGQETVLESTGQASSQNSRPASLVEAELFEYSTVDELYSMLQAYEARRQLPDASPYATSQPARERRIHRQDETTTNSSRRQQQQHPPLFEVSRDSSTTSSTTSAGSSSTSLTRHSFVAPDSTGNLNRDSATQQSRNRVQALRPRPSSIHGLPRPPHTPPHHPTASITAAAAAAAAGASSGSSVATSSSFSTLSSVATSSSFSTLSGVSSPVTPSSAHYMMNDFISFPGSPSQPTAGAATLQRTPDVDDEGLPYKLMTPMLAAAMAALSEGNIAQLAYFPPEVLGQLRIVSAPSTSYPKNGSSNSQVGSPGSGMGPKGRVPSLEVM